MPQSSVSMGGRSSSVTLECDCLAHRFGNAADNGFRQARYPTDMPDAKWAVVRPLLPVWAAPGQAPVAAGTGSGRGPEPMICASRLRPGRSTGRALALRMTTAAWCSGAMASRLR